MCLLNCVRRAELLFRRRIAGLTLRTAHWYDMALLAVERGGENANHRPVDSEAFKIFPPKPCGVESIRGCTEAPARHPTEIICHHIVEPNPAVRVREDPFYEFDQMTGLDYQTCFFEGFPSDRVAQLFTNSH